MIINNLLYVYVARLVSHNDIANNILHRLVL